MACLCVSLQTSGNVQENMILETVNRRQDQSNLNQEGVSPVNGSNRFGHKLIAKPRSYWRNRASKYRMIIFAACYTNEHTLEAIEKPESALNSGATTKAVGQGHAHCRRLQIGFDSSTRCEPGSAALRGEEPGIKRGLNLTRCL